jgi:hypothetical protein
MPVAFYRRLSVGELSGYLPERIEFVVVNGVCACVCTCAYVVREIIAV